jgi:hypothetical protein
MTGLFVKKYHVAVMDEDKTFASQVVSALKSLYNSRIVIETYSDSQQMFNAINDFKAKSCPFDLMVMSPNDIAEKMILQITDPKMPVLLCQDIKTLKVEASKFLL